MDIQQEEKSYTLEKLRQEFLIVDSGLLDHPVFTLPSVNFSWRRGQILIKLCNIFWAEQILGVTLLEITVHRQNEP